MRSIYKYPLEFGINSVEMPELSIPIKFGMQNNTFTVWCMVDRGSRLVRHKFQVLGTGHEIDSEVKRITPVGTAFDGEFVWHCLSFGDK